jgi:hypothetical protein
MNQETSSRSRTGTEGAVFVEFLIVFLPVLTFFLCLVQLSLLFAVQLVVEHAAVNTARAAAVIISDDPKSYKNEPLHKISSKSSERYGAIERAALLSLAPYIFDGSIYTVNVLFPPPDQPGGKGRDLPVSFTPMSDSSISKVRVRLEVLAACKIAIANRIACGGVTGLLSSLGVPFIRPTRTIAGESVYPYQGARYKYQP